VFRNDGADDHDTAAIAATAAADDYYGAFCEPSVTQFASSVQKYVTGTARSETERVTIVIPALRGCRREHGTAPPPLESPSSDSGISSDKSPPLLAKSDLLICKYQPVRSFRSLLRPCTHVHNFYN